MKFLQKNVLKHLQVADIADLTVSSTVQEGCKLLQGMGVKFLHHLFPDECFYIEYRHLKSRKFMRFLNNERFF